jgi:hypothetical protein
MRRGLERRLAVLLAGLAMAQAGCRSEHRSWTPPDELKVKIVSEAAFVRTDRGDYIDGYLAEYESEFQKRRMFMALEIVRYDDGDRLIVTGRFNGDFVRRPSDDPALAKVPVFEVEKAKPNVPAAPNIPAIK